MAESMPREEYERLLFFESAREQAEAEWSENNRDTQARLVRGFWALLCCARRTLALCCSLCCGICGATAHPLGFSPLSAS